MPSRFLLCAALALCLTLTAACAPKAAPIDRQALVTRHNITATTFDPRSPLSVGNGMFAFTADLTGLQTFPDLYAKAMPLCTQSQRGWHSAPMPAGLNPDQVRYANFDTFGRPVGYLTSSAEQTALFNYLAENPHRLHLGRLALDLRHADGSTAVPADIKNPVQTLELWTGILTSRFEFDGQPVTVETSCPGPSLDAVAVKITSPLVSAGRARLLLAFPYGSPGLTAADWSHPDAHVTTLSQPAPNRADFARQLDGDAYAASLTWSTPAEFATVSQRDFTLTAKPNAASLEFLCAFGSKAVPAALPTPAEAATSSRESWKKFWSTGGAIDLSGSTDPRAKELERRIVLSEYVTAVNSRSDLPPQETGLVCNTWYGKFHLEMHWWHSVHFALWGRFPEFEKALGFYEKILPIARETAQRQDYAGARWPKMVGPDGHDSPSPIGPLLIWQQPHPIYYAELCFRDHPGKTTLERWLPIITETADFMASYAHLDPATGRYVLGPPIKTVPEHNDTNKTSNPTFELSYWRFGLRTAQAWRERLGLAPNPKWEEVLKNLAPLPTADGLYLSEQGLTDTYTQWNWEHPSLIGPLGMLPGDGVDPATMRRTVEKVMQVWDWEKCWGWDFPMMAMAAARNGRPDLAIDALLVKSVKNTYLPNGHNYQRENAPLPCYLPGNGGLLTAVAMMAAGWDGAPDTPAPGFPTPAQGWTVRYENLKRMP